MGLGRADRPGSPGGVLHAAPRLLLLAAGALRRPFGLLAAGALTRARALLAAAALAGLGALPALAQDLPATFRVDGVAARDVLNVRALPSTGGAILTTLRPTAEGIEVLAFSEDGAWAQVPLPEGSGWVSRRFLEAEATPRDRIPRPLQCRGTEPFWSLTLEEDGSASLDLPGRAPPRLRPLGEIAGRDGWIAAFDVGGQTADLTVVRRACSDGMSDRPYGLYAMVWDRGDRLFEGCCTLQP